MSHRWEQLAELDPFFVALSDKRHAHGGWDPSRFIESGRPEIDRIFERLEELHLSPARTESALDFGCGPGRLTQALAERFSEAHGVDVSARMLEIAQELAAGRDACHFHRNEDTDLALFEAGRFDFVYSSKVLFHLRPKVQLAFLREFYRVVRPGGLVCFGVSLFAQSGSIRDRWYYRYRAVRRRLINRQNQYYAMRALRFSPRWLYRTFGLRPMMPMYTVEEARIIDALAACGAEIVAVDRDPRPHRVGAMYYTRAPGDRPS